MDLSYRDKHHHLLEQASRISGLDQSDYRRFCERMCSPPFSRVRESAELWAALWPELSQNQQTELLNLPDPCLNHLEDRTRKPERAQNLMAGCLRLVRSDAPLFMQALRLFPHALCRTAEAIGPLPEGLWVELQTNLRTHRLWSFAEVKSPAELWSVVDLLAKHRELPQSILDFLETGRPRESAPWEDFVLSLQRYLVRERIEALRFLTYGMLTGRVARTAAS